MIGYDHGSLPPFSSILSEALQITVGIDHHRTPLHPFAFPSRPLPFLIMINTLIPIRSNVRDGAHDREGFCSIASMAGEHRE